MDRRTFLGSAAAFAAMLANRSHAQVKVQESLAELLEGALQEHELPGIAAAIVRGGKTIAEAAAGVRKVGGDAKITLDNRFGMASCTKRMTAAMVCRVIDSGRLALDTTLAEALPDLTMRDDYKAVTVGQLLNHTGGLPSYLQVGSEVTPNLNKLSGTPAEQRQQFITLPLQDEPIVKPGTESRYSNAGYALVGFVAEQRTGKSWEALMREEVFKPLAMANAGFGRPRTADRPDEPWLHAWTGDKYEPESEDRVNALEALAPAGNVHCSIRDFCEVRRLRAGGGSRQQPAGLSRNGPPVCGAVAMARREGEVRAAKEDWAWGGSRQGSQDHQRT
jgi:CubicO group peptidase (beta-lactamase class C family)